MPYLGAGLGYAYAGNVVNGVEDAQNALSAFGETGLPITVTSGFSFVPAFRLN